MRIEALLDKRESLKIELLRYLILNDEVSLSELGHHLNLSINTLKLYMKELCELELMGSCGISFKLSQTFVSLSLRPGLNLDRITAFYLKDSLEFLFLRELMVEQKLSIVYLAQKFSISESSIFRRIKKLNLLLKEFGLFIKNGSMEGEEIQIRYFYFLIFEYMYQNSTSFFGEYFSKKQVRQVARDLLAEFSLDKVSSDLEARLLIWLEISRLRIRLLGDKKIPLRRANKIFQVDQLYQDIRPFVEVYARKLHSKNVDFESLALYAFVNSLGLLDEKRQYGYELLRSKRLPTAMLDVYIREYILKHYPTRRISLKLEKQVGFYLAKSSNRLFFFDGSLERYDWTNLLRRQKNLISRDLFRLASKLQAIALKELKNYKKEEPACGVKNYLLVSYINILSFIDFNSTGLVNIAIDQESLPIFALNYSHYLYQNLRMGQEGINIESYNPKQDYDLLITCRQSIKVNKNCKLYRLSEYESNYDLRQIEALIEEIKISNNLSEGI
ncbi:helix-turn-helix domain-containing protein [Streptococcaceae bacterium ESL0729]|nr:helix-turn-helix domain-containing protein [Streptococcaceae bacterium ESL0729]